MTLQSCVITLTNKEIIVSQSVETSLYLLESQVNNSISKVKINTYDGFQERSYIFFSVEESLETLMNL